MLDKAPFIRLFWSSYSQDRCESTGVFLTTEKVKGHLKAGRAVQLCSTCTFTVCTCIYVSVLEAVYSTVRTALSQYMYIYNVQQLEAVD